MKHKLTFLLAVLMCCSLLLAALAPAMAAEEWTQKANDAGEPTLEELAQLNESATAAKTAYEDAVTTALAAGLEIDSDGLAYLPEELDDQADLIQLGALIGVVKASKAAWDAAIKQAEALGVEIVYDEDYEPVPARPDEEPAPDEQDKTEQTIIEAANAARRAYESAVKTAQAAELEIDSDGYAHLPAEMDDQADPMQLQALIESIKASKAAWDAAIKQAEALGVEIVYDEDYEPAPARPDEVADPDELEMAEQARIKAEAAMAAAKAAAEQQGIEIDWDAIMNARAIAAGEPDLEDPNVIEALAKAEAALAAAKKAAEEQGIEIDWDAILKLPALPAEQPCEHEYETVVTAPTCTKAGYTTYTCAKCGDKYTDDEVPALDHDFKDGVCTRCGAWDDLPSLISVDLQEQMKIMGDDARVMVAIDLKGLDQDFVLSEIAKESGLDENTVKKVLNGEAALADSMAYIDAQRAVLKRLYTKYNNDFLAAYLPDLPADCRYYVADTHATIWASLKKEEIMNIAWKDQVFSMGYVSYAYDPLIPGDMESPNQPCEHDYNAVVKVPTCTESGNTIYTCTKCNDKYISDEIAALEHSWDEGEVTKEPSETENGERTFTCSRCGEKKTESIPVKEHVHNYIEVKTAPTCTEDGYSVFTCACGRSYKGDEVPALGHDFKDGVCTRCEAKDPDYEEPVIEPFRFDDVKDSKQFYFAPVYWAVDQKITRGTSEKLFSPDEGCTRGQVVTFLWRAAGEPEPTKAENPFQDVKSDAYYSTAVLWAVEKGITKGTSADAFSPDATCTRAQLVTFLYRANGAPEVSRKSKPFTDVDAAQYYADAVAWAVENGITTGKSPETFAPNATCTRAEVVTFLYRAGKA